MIGGVPIVVFLLVTCRFQFVKSDSGQEIGRPLDELSDIGKPCPYNQYNDGSSSYCKACPANSGHGIIGSTSVSDCTCFKGYAGSPQHGLSCTVRSCEKLAPPQNGAFVGTCNSVYESVCRIECNEGYELLGSEERKCIVSEYGLMDWSGIASQCVAIRCPFLFVPNAFPPVCSSFLLSPGTYCSFRCKDGFYMKGSEVRVCQQDKSWTGSQTTCEQKAVF
ncbi:E-selectin-like [Porites lutea]|uniref:E-selectin-like n=1 Tax=Porites lutea TaxID=51062 RepID=UPI003CC6078A